MAAFVEGAAKGLRDTYQDVPAAVATVQRMAPEANVDTEVATRQLELIRDLVITDNSRTNGHRVVPGGAARGDQDAS